MEFKNKKITTNEKIKAIICIAIGTGTGLITYLIFLYFNIAIFGWNFGLIFAPLVAGYVETIIANRIIGENIGAISAFILFIYTTFYSFILKNPTLGVNFITAGAVIVILQAAFPTLINFILLVVIGGIRSNFIKSIKKYEKKIKLFIQKHQPFHWKGTTVEIEVDALPIFDEMESNEKLNNLDFYFLTSTDIIDSPHEIIGIYHSEVIMEKDSSIIHTDPKKTEIEHLVKIKESKDACLIKLAKEIKNNGGNGILDLSMNYSLIGHGGDNIQVTAMGMGIYIDVD